MKIPRCCLFLLFVLSATGWGAENLLRNGELVISADTGLVEGWRNSPADGTLHAETQGLPQGVKGALRIETAQEASSNQGQLYQRLPVPAGSGKLKVSAYVRSTGADQAFLQIKLYNGKKELKRLGPVYGGTEWKQVEYVFQTEGADTLEILCRWRREQRFTGKPVWFADVRLEPAAEDATVGLVEPRARVVLALAGDSTVQDYPEASERRGWGQELRSLLNEDVRILNFARGGRSSKTFRSEGDWRKLIEARPDIVLIQFGHNDSHAPEKPESTNAQGEYADNLRAFIREANEAGAMPVLITPPQRRVFAEPTALSAVLEPYAQVTREVAKELNIPYIDLYKASSDELLARGEAASTELFCSIKDRSHFSAAGAHLLAKEVANGLSAAGGKAGDIVKMPGSSTRE